MEITKEDFFESIVPIITENEELLNVVLDAHQNWLKNKCNETFGDKDIIETAEWNNLSCASDKIVSIDSVYTDQSRKDGGRPSHFILAYASGQKCTVDKSFARTGSKDSSSRPANGFTICRYTLATK